MFLSTDEHHALVKRSQTCSHLLGPDTCWKCHHLQQHIVGLKSVKCYTGGRKLDLISSISEIVTNVIPLCSVYQAPSYGPNLTLLAWFLRDLAYFSMLFSLEVLCTARISQLRGKWCYKCKIRLIRLRAVKNVDMSYPTLRLYSDLQVDNVRVDMMKATCKMVHKGFYNVGPDSLNDMFVLYEPERELRSGDELQIVACKYNTCFGQRNIAYRGCKYWSMLPITNKSSTSPDALKKPIKLYHGFG